jgi:hypothetical protein
MTKTKIRLSKEKEFLALNDVWEINELDPDTALAYLHVDLEDDCDHLGIQFAIASALYQFGSEYHAGQHCRLYQIMSCLGMDPIRYQNHIGFDTECPTEEFVGEEQEDDRYCYDLLVSWFEKGGIPGPAMPGHPLDPHFPEDEDDDG